MQLVVDLVKVSVWAAPHVRRLWINKAAPALRSARDKSASRLAEVRERVRQSVPMRNRHGDGDELATFEEPVSADSPEGVTTAVEPYVPGMSGAEAQQRLAVALIAKAVSDEQFGILLGARIDDADGLPAGREPVENLTAEQVEHRIRQMLASDPALLTEIMVLLARSQSGAAEPQQTLPTREDSGGGGLE